MYVPRYIEKFENTDGDVSYKFPLVGYEWESVQPLRSPYVAVSGANYGVNLRSGNPGLKEAGQERIRFSIHHKCSPAEIDSKIDQMRSKLYTIGLGKLWTRDSENARRFAWGQIVEMPEHLVTFEAPINLKLFPTSLEFRRESDWYGYPIIAEEAAATGTVIINNPGNANVWNAVLVLRGTFTNPTIQLDNDAGSYLLTSSRDGTSNAHRLKLDAGRYTVEFSSNAGVSYADDYALYARSLLQTDMFVLAPGDTEVTFTGMTSATLAWSFYPAYH